MIYFKLQEIVTSAVKKVYIEKKSTPRGNNLHKVSIYFSAIRQWKKNWKKKGDHFLAARVNTFVEKFSKSREKGVEIRWNV